MEVYFPLAQTPRAVTAADMVRVQLTLRNWQMLSELLVPLCLPDNSLSILISLHPNKWHDQSFSFFQMFNYLQTEKQSDRKGEIGRRLLLHSPNAARARGGSDRSQEPDLGLTWEPRHWGPPAAACQDAGSGPGSQDCSAQCCHPGCRAPSDSSVCVTAPTPSYFPLSRADPRLEQSSKGSWEIHIMKKLHMHF